MKIYAHVVDEVVKYLYVEISIDIYLNMYIFSSFTFIGETVMTFRNF